MSVIHRIAFRALQRDAAVDHQHLAGNVAGVVAEQEFHGMADVPAGAFGLQHRGIGALGACRSGTTLCSDGGIACIALSANAMPEDIERGLAAGFADYWTKPLDLKAFLRAMDTLFGPAPA